MLTEARHAAALLFMGISGRAGLRLPFRRTWLFVGSLHSAEGEECKPWVTPESRCLDCITPRRAAWRQGLVAENVTTAEINHARASRGEGRNA